MPRRKRALKLSTPAEVRRAIARVANMILNEEIDPKSANAILYACNSILAAVRIDDQQRKIDELEKMLDNLTTK